MTLINAPASETGKARGSEHQNISRMTMVLSALAESASDGLRLVDVVRRTGLSKTVAHRCLAGLTAQGLAAFEAESARFFIGDRILAWSTAASSRFALSERVKPFAQNVADETQDTVYFMLRRGDEAICYGRAEGGYPIKTLTLNVGERRLLGTNTGGLAIIATLGDSEIAAMMDRNTEGYAAAAINRDLLPQLIRQTREAGYSLIDGLVMPGMSGIGVTVRADDGRTVAALSVAAISPRLQGDRRANIVERLKIEAAQIERHLAPLLRT